MSSILSLSLDQFRNYGAARLDAADSPFVVITGRNGAGKTNILEAISLLTPGRGLRGDAAPVIQKEGVDTPWSVGAMVASPYGEVRLGTALDRLAARRQVSVQGRAASSQQRFLDYIRLVWLTPYQDRLFMDGASERRRFLDRVVFTLDPAHAGRLTRYEKAMAQRLSLLKEKRGQDTWFDALEMQMAEAATAIAAARLDCVARLQTAVDRLTAECAGDFPHAFLKGVGDVEMMMENRPAVEVEKMLLDSWRRDRARDGDGGMTHTGPHRADLHVFDRVSMTPALRGSTGEQKALLITLILAQADLIRGETDIAPILLLDEVVAHLDPVRRAALFARLALSAGQVWMTGTETLFFDDVRSRARFVTVDKGALATDAARAAA